jgi:hypothetical protein
MRDLFILIVHLITTVIRLSKPGGLRTVVAESMLAKHQMLILNRSRRRAPNLYTWDRLIAAQECAVAGLFYCVTKPLLQKAELALDDAEELINRRRDVRSGLHVALTIEI